MVCALAKARGLSLRTGQQTMLYLPLVLTILNKNKNLRVNIFHHAIVSKKVSFKYHFHLGLCNQLLITVA